MSLKIGLYQFAPQFGEKESNLRQTESALQLTDADLLVFPELCTTGYQFISHEETASLAEAVPDGPAVQRWADLAKSCKKHIVAGLAEDDRGKIYNTSVLIGPNGFIGKYRKVHLFCEEKTWFHPGDLGFPVWDIGPAKIGMMICFDWIFPEAAYSLARQGADIICHPVNLVLPYCQQAMVTRSIENSVFTITANRIGSEERGGKDPLTFTGGSQAVGPRGELLFRLGNDNEALQEITIDPEKARDKQIIKQNHIWRDRRSEQYFKVE